MPTPEQAGFESEPEDLREQLRRKLQGARIEDRQITNFAQQAIDTQELNTEGRIIDKNFRIRFPDRPNKMQVKEIDEAVLSHYQNKHDDVEVKRDEVTSEGKQRAIELSGGSEKITIVRTSLENSVEITTEIISGPASN